MAFNPNSISFGDLPKQPTGNIFTALSQATGGVGDVLEEKDKREKKEKVDAQMEQLRNAQITNISKQNDVTQLSLDDASALKKMGDYTSYDAFLKENPVSNPQTLKSVQEFYTAYNQKLDSDSAADIIAELKRNNKGVLPSKDALNEQLPSLVNDKAISNKALGLVYQAVDTENAVKLESDVKKAQIGHYQTSDQVALQNAETDAMYKKAHAISLLKKEPTDHLAKEKETYKALVQSGEIDPKVTEFGSWLAQSGGKVTIKSESVTNARNKGRDQLSGISNLVNERLMGYDPTQHGIMDGIIQKAQEILPFQTEKSAQLESDRKGAQSAAATAMFGGKPTNYQTKIAEDMLGGSVITEAGTAGKLKSVLNQSILNTEETIRQIKSSKGDASDLEDELAKYKVIAKNLEKWDGSTPATPYLDPNYGKNTPKEATVISVRQKPATQEITPPSVEPKTPTMTKFNSEEELIGAIMGKGYSRDEAIDYINKQGK